MKVIYQIKELKTNKIYIGSTLNYKNRRTKHISTLINKNHHNIYLQRLFNKHNDINFIEFSILEEFKNSEEQFILEQKWIDLLKPSLNIGSVGGGDNLSLNPNKENICERISKTLKLNYSLMSEEERKKKHGRPLELNPNWKNGIYLKKLLVHVVIKNLIRLKFVMNVVIKMVKIIRFLVKNIQKKQNNI